MWRSSVYRQNDLMQLQVILTSMKDSYMEGLLWNTPLGVTKLRPEQYFTGKGCILFWKTRTILWLTKTNVYLKVLIFRKINTHAFICRRPKCSVLWSLNRFCVQLWEEYYITCISSKYQLLMQSHASRMSMVSAVNSCFSSSIASEPGKYCKH